MNQNTFYARSQAAVELYEYNMRLCEEPTAKYTPHFSVVPLGPVAPVPEYHEPRYTLGIYHPRTGHRYNSVCGGRTFTYDEAVSKRDSLNGLSGMTGTICRLEEV